MADNNNPIENNAVPNEIQVNARDRLFHAIFIKAAAVYIRVVPKWCRSFFEVVVLAKALILFTTLSYIHFTFSKNPMDCLDKFKDDWPRDGILQVQVLKDKQNISIDRPKLPPYFATKWNHSLANHTSDDNDKCSIDDVHDTETHKNASAIEKMPENHAFVDTIDEEYLMKRQTVVYEKILFHARSQEEQTYLPSMQYFIQSYGNKQVKDYYVMEYSLEYGFLRLSPEARKKLKIPVKVVSLDPKVDKCFGDSLSRFILDKFLGYDDLLMASIKKLAENEGNKGYMKNVLSGEHYKFVTMWMGRTSYAVSLLLMFVFTISISMLLRFCHQQIFIFIVHMLQMMEWNASLAFPVAPLFTVILSLVGMEAIMAEFFNDTTTSFYIILIVWAADQFDSICCHTRLSQKYWLRFFYLYHFLFYGYHYRFNGQYSSIALAASWFFTQHSMLYFLHNYEIPVIEAAMNAQGVNYLDDAVDLLVDEMQFQFVPENNMVTPQNAETAAEEAGEAASEANGEALEGDTSNGSSGTVDEGSEMANGVAVAQMNEENLADREKKVAPNCDGSKDVLNVETGNAVSFEQLNANEMFENTCTSPGMSDQDDQFIQTTASPGRRGEDSFFDSVTDDDTDSNNPHLNCGKSDSKSISIYNKLDHEYSLDEPNVEHSNGCHRLRQFVEMNNSVSCTKQNTKMK